MYVFRLEIYIFRLKICVFRLEMEIVCRIFGICNGLGNEYEESFIIGLAVHGGAVGAGFRAFARLSL